MVKDCYTGDYCTIKNISIYDKNEDYLVNNAWTTINHPTHTVTLEDITTMYGNEFDASSIGTVSIDSWNTDYDLLYNYGTVENPNWGYYYWDYPTISAQDIIDGKLAYTGSDLRLYTNIQDTNGDNLVYWSWGNTIHSFNADNIVSLEDIATMYEITSTLMILQEFLLIVGM